MRRPSGYEPLLADIERHIAEVGWSLMGVGGWNGEPSYMYTIGFIESLGHPELITVGLPPDAESALLNQIGERIVAGESFAPGDEIAHWDYRWRFGAVHPSHWSQGRFAMWGFYYRTRRRTVSLLTRALQIVWADERGIFPGEPGWNTAYDPCVLDLSAPASGSV